jgi:hypothetical protein
MAKTKAPEHFNMRTRKPEMDQYIHIICNDGKSTYGWFKGNHVDLTVLQDPDVPSILIENVAAWRPIYK